LNNDEQFILNLI